MAPPIENTCTIGFFKLLRDKRNLIIESPTHNKLKFDEIQASFKNKNFPKAKSFDCLSFIRTAHRLPGRLNLSSR